MSYAVSVFGTNNLWYLRDEPNDIDLTTILINSDSTSTHLRAWFMEGTDRWDVLIEGSFDLSNNPKTAAELVGATATKIDVTVSGLPNEFITYDAGFDLVMWITNQGYRLTLLDGDDIFSGSRSDTIYGDNVRGGPGNDIFIGYNNGVDQSGRINYDSFFGESGIDTARYLGKLSEYRIDTNYKIWDGRYEVQTMGVAIVDSIKNRDGTDWLKEVERLQFSDTMVGLDIGKGGNTGEVYRLYLTVLGRNPEPVGCGFWIDKLDRDILTTEQMVGYFLDSDEFVTRFGGTTNANEDFVNLLYLNLLGRDGHPDSGFSFWRNVLDKELASREAVVVGFMESEENISNAAAKIGDTPTYQQWVENA